MKTNYGRVQKSRSPNDVDRLVGQKLRALRMKAGYSLESVAGLIGVSHQQLQKYETGANRLSVGMLPSVADALGVDIMEFFEDADKLSPAKSEADHLRGECVIWLNRTKSEEVLRGMLRVLKALAN